MIVSLIVAKARNNAIGKDNRLLWHLPADMKFFRETTSGHCIITGRKNFESIPEKYRPLANRTNIVVTRNKEYPQSGIELTHSLESALEFAKKLGETEVFIIGGGQIYKEAIEKDLVHRMYITEVDAEFEADTFFPDFSKEQWEVISSQELPKIDSTDIDVTINIYSNVKNLFHAGNLH